MIVLVFMMCFFFFKHKTAYEMRISDWSSDVCSSDLGRSPRKTGWRRPAWPRHPARKDGRERKPLLPSSRNPILAARIISVDRCILFRTLLFGRLDCRACIRDHRASLPHRSEEHTSELQSLMRISYAVFCLKKKKIQSTSKTI